MATLPAGSVAGINEPLRVLEDLLTTDAPIVFEGVTLRFELAKRTEPQYNTSVLWGGRPLKEVLDSESDLLGNELLDAVDEPSYSTVAALAPPAVLPARSCGDFALGDGQTFLGSRIASEKHGFSVTGAKSYGDINQAFHLQTEQLLINRTSAGVLGRWLPSALWRWSLPNGDHAEQLAFAPPEGSDDHPLDVSSPQPVWVRYLNISATGELRYVHYVDSWETYPNYCHTAPADGFPTQLECNGEGAVTFYASLLSFARYWNHTILHAEAPMTIELPDERLSDFAMHSIARLMITRRDKFFPRYGAPPDAYGAPMTDGFQDTLCADVATYLEWGLHETARGVLNNYFTFYLRSRARVAYRGPEIAQYGRMLTLTAQYFKHTSDDGLLLQHSSKLLDVCTMLLDRRDASLDLPRSDPSYGMMRGADESDEVFTEWRRGGTELPHLSFSLEAWRGFVEIGPIWSSLGRVHGKPDLVAMGARLLNVSGPLLADVYAAIDKSTVPSVGGLTCNPYVAGAGACADMNHDGPSPHARVSHTSFPYNFRASEPWRSYSGMFYAGGLNSSVVRAIVSYNQQRSHLSRLGVWGGGPGFANRMMGFTAQGHGYGLLQHDLIKPLLLLLNTQMAHVCSRGTWTCFESRGLPNFPPAGGYATPSQAVVPLLLKWMLIFETPPAARAPHSSSDVNLTLCRGTPREWLRDGRRIVVRNAPTALGVRVNMTVVSSLGSAVPSVDAVIALSPMPTASTAGGRVAIRLRLRAPDMLRLAKVEVDGKAWTGFDTADETVTLPSMEATSVTRCVINATFTAAVD